MDSSAKDRRHAIAQWLESNPTATNAQLAAKYEVSTRTISQDRAKLREGEAHQVETEDPLDNLKRAYRRDQEVVEEGKAGIKLGTKLYLDHCVTGARLALAHLKSLQSVGVIPRNIGCEEIKRWDFVSPTTGLGTVCDPRQR